MNDRQKLDKEFDTQLEMQRQPDRMMDVSMPQAGKVLTIASIVMVGALLIGGLIAIAPDVKSKIEMSAEQEQRIAQLEKELAEVKTSPPVDEPQTETSFDVRSLIPADIQNKMNSMSSEVQNLSSQAAALQKTVTDLQSGSMPERLAKLESNVSTFLNTEQQAALSAMFQKVQTMGASVQGQQSMDQAMQALLGAVQSNAADPIEALQTVREVNPDVASTMEGVAPEDVQAATMLLALAQLRQSLQRDNNSFDTDLSLLKETLAKDNPELQSAIDRLAPQAKVGVLTPQGLSRELQSMTGEIVEASLQGKDVSVQDKAMARLNDFIKVEKNGVPITGNETQLTIAEAQKRLDTGDVAGAIKTLETLDGSAGAKTKPLLEQAQATLVASELQGLLGQNMVGQLQNTIRQMSAGGTVNTQGLQSIITQVQNMIPNQGLITNAAGQAQIYVPPLQLPKTSSAP
jgi:hypothetical protein